MERKPSQKRTPVMKKMLCVLFSILSVFMIMPYQPALIAEALEETVFLSTLLGQTKELKPNEVYYSPHRTYTCVFQSDGNLAVYRHRPWLAGNQFTYNNIVWSSCTGGNPNSKCYLQKDGNLVIYNASGRPIFSAGYSSRINVKSELRLSDLGVLTLHSNFSDRWATSLAHYNGKGHIYRHEPDACRLVGRWVAFDCNLQPLSAYIDIDFPDYPPNPERLIDNFAMNVDYSKVKNWMDTRWKNAKNIKIYTSSFKDSTNLFKDWEFTMVADLRGTDDDRCNCFYCNDDGTQLDLGSSPFKLNSFRRLIYY